MNDWRVTRFSELFGFLLQWFWLSRLSLFVSFASATIDISHWNFEPSIYCRIFFSLLPTIVRHSRDNNYNWIPRHDPLHKNTTTLDFSSAFKELFVFCERITTAMRRGKEWKYVSLGLNVGVIARATAYRRVHIRARTSTQTHEWHTHANKMKSYIYKTMFAQRSLAYGP